MRSRESKITDLGSLVRSLIELGYTREHEWYDGHGEGGSLTFQSPGDEERGVFNLMVYYNRAGQATSLIQGNSDNYRMARKIREDKDMNRFSPASKIQVSPCHTSSYQDFEDRNPKVYWRLSSTAGHGEHAFRITPNEVGEPWRD